MPKHPVLGIVAGLDAERAALGHWRCDPRIATALSASSPERAEAAAMRLAEHGVRALVSWGVAGGLDPALRPGDLVSGAAVVDVSGTVFALEAPALDTPATPMPAVRIAGTEKPVLTPAGKSLLQRQTLASIVDMETHRLARAGAERGVPVAAIRAVLDPAGRALPSFVADALDAEGRPRISAVLAGLCRTPTALPSLVSLGLGRRAALRALAGTADRVCRELLQRYG